MKIIRTFVKSLAVAGALPYFGLCGGFVVAHEGQDESVVDLEYVVGAGYGGGYAVGSELVPAQTIVDLAAELSTLGAYSPVVETPAGPVGDTLSTICTTLTVPAHADFITSSEDVGIASSQVAASTVVVTPTDVVDIPTSTPFVSDTVPTYVAETSSFKTSSSTAVVTFTSTTTGSEVPSFTSTPADAAPVAGVSSPTVITDLATLQLIVIAVIAALI